MQSLICNDPLCSETGLPPRTCSCGWHRAATRNAAPAFDRDDPPLQLPTINWGARDDDDIRAPVAAFAWTGEPDDRPLDLPTINWRDNSDQYGVPRVRTPRQMLDEIGLSEYGGTDDEAARENAKRLGLAGIGHPTDMPLALPGDPGYLVD